MFDLIHKGWKRLVRLSSGEKVTAREDLGDMFYQILENYMINHVNRNNEYSSL